MGARRFLSILCLGLAVSAAVSQDITPQNVPEVTSDNIVAVSFYIEDILYDAASHDDIKETVNAMMSEVGGEMASIEVIDGSPCVRVFLEWKNADNIAIFGLFRRLTSSGLEADGKKYSIGFEKCQDGLHPPVPVLGCSDTWKENEVDSVCIKVINNMKKDFNGARKVCQKEGGDLVTMVTNSRQNNFVKGLSNKKKRYWIGISKTKREKDYKLVDRSPLGQFDVFRRGKRNKDKRKTRCVDIKNGKWYGSVCRRKRNFVCQRDLH